GCAGSEHACSPISSRRTYHGSFPFASQPHRRLDRPGLGRSEARCLPTSDRLHGGRALGGRAETGGPAHLGRRVAPPLSPRLPCHRSGTVAPLVALCLDELRLSRAL